MKEPARFQTNWRQFKRRCVIYTSFFILLPIAPALAENITLISSEPAHMTAGVSSDTITVSFTFSAAIDHENMYWDSFMLFPWGPYTSYTLYDRWFSEDGKTAYVKMSHIPDTDFVWFIMDLPGVEGGRMENVHIVNYSTRDDLSALTVSGSLSYQPFDDQDTPVDDQSLKAADDAHLLFPGGGTPSSPTEADEPESSPTEADEPGLYWGNAIISLLDDISWLGEPEGFMGSMPHIANVGKADPLTGEYRIENVRPGEYYLTAMNFEPIKGENGEPIVGVYGLDLIGSPPATIIIGEDGMDGVDIVLYDSIPDVPLDFDGEIFVESSYPAHMAAGVSTESITVRFGFNAAVDDRRPLWEDFMLFPHRQYTLHNRWFAVNHMTAYADITHQPDTDYVWRIMDLPGMDGGHMNNMQVINYTTRDAISELTISGQLSLSPELQELIDAAYDASTAWVENATHAAYSTHAACENNPARATHATHTAHASCSANDARPSEVAHTARIVAEDKNAFSWGMATVALFDDISWYGGPDGMMGGLPHQVNVGKVDPETGLYLVENVRPGEYWLLAAHLEPVRDANYDPFIAFYGETEPMAVAVTDESVENRDIELDMEWDTGADDHGETGIPETIVLHQNYPNPFNPVTRIRYDLSSNSDVLLEVYDLLGRRIATLTDARLPAGRHSAVFDASSIASGVYLYHLTVGHKTLARQMTVLR